jgi:hypothetical protein
MPSGADQIVRRRIIPTRSAPSSAEIADVLDTLCADDT